MAAAIRFLLPSAVPVETYTVVASLTLSLTIQTRRMRFVTFNLSRFTWPVKIGSASSGGEVGKEGRQASCS